MHAAGLDNGSNYGIDICKDEISCNDETDRANDLRAIVNLIHQDNSVREIQRKILAVAPVNNLSERAEMIKRGIDELRKLIEDKASKTVRRATGI